MDDHERQLIEAQRTEAMALFTTAHSYNVRNDQLVGFGVTLIAAAAALGLKEKVDEVLLGVPVALVMLMTYATQVDTDVRVLGVARLGLERQLSRRLKVPALVYQSHAAPFRGREYTRGIMGVQVVVTLLALASAIAAGALAEDKGAWAFALYVILLASLFLSLFWALWENRRAESRAEDALKSWAEPPADAPR